MIRRKDVVIIVVIGIFFVLTSLAATLGYHFGTAAPCNEVESIDIHPVPR